MNTVQNYDFTSRLASTPLRLVATAQVELPRNLLFSLNELEDLVGAEAIETVLSCFLEEAMIHMREDATEIENRHMAYYYHVLMDSFKAIFAVRQQITNAQTNSKSF